MDHLPRVRLAWFLYAISLLAAASAGNPITELGVFGGVFVVLGWLAIHLFGSILSHALQTGFMLGLVLSVLFLMPAVGPTSNPPEGSRCRRCADQMQSLAYALKHCRSRHGRLPDNVLSEDGVHLSWRTRFVSDLGDAEYAAKHNLPDGVVSPALTSMAEEPPFCYWCYGFGDGWNAYFAIRDSKASWPEDTHRPQPSGRDYDVDTVVLIEASNNAVGNWQEPVDLSFEEAVDLLTTLPKEEVFDGHWRSLECSTR